MELFRIENHSAVLDNPGVAMIREFKKILTRDNDRQKRNAYKFLAFVYLYSDYRSPFCNERGVFKVEAIKKELLIDPSWDLELDNDVMEAIAKYNQLTETPIIRLLKGARNAIEKMETYFETIDFTQRNDRTNALIFTPKEVLNAIAEIGEAHEGLDKLEDTIKKASTLRSKIQGGGEIGEFEV